MIHEDNTMIRVKSIRFGDLEVPESHRVTFPEGLLGFASDKDYVFVEDTEAPPFFWMQSLNDSELAFVTIDPLLFVPNYEVEMKQADINLLGLTSLEEAKVLVIVVLREKIEETTANLQGPIVINPNNHLAKQIVLLGDRYSVRYPILTHMDSNEAVV